MRKSLLKKKTKTYKIKCFRRKYLKPLKVEVVGIFPPNSKISIKIEIKGKGKD